jgi:type I restriction enzyme S subunit
VVGGPVPSEASVLNSDVPERVRLTDVGVLPADWHATSLRKLCRNIIDFRGRTPRKLGMDWGGGDIPALSARNVRMGAIELQEETYFGSDALYKRWMTRGDAEKGDIVITTEAPLGNVALIPDHRKYILSQRAVLLQVDPSQVVSTFLFQAMMSEGFQRTLSSNASGSTATGIQRRRLEKLELHLPPLPEQRAIAGALADVDVTVGVLDKLIAKTRAMKRGAAQQLLVGQVRLPGFWREWTTERLANLVEIDPENLSESTDPDFAFNYISLEDVDRGQLGGFTEETFATSPSRARRVLRPGDVLMATVRPALQSHLLYNGAPERAVCSTGFAVLRSKRDRAVPGFIFAQLFSQSIGTQIERILAGTSYPAINRADVRQLLIECPQVDEQTAIAAVLSDMDGEIELMETRRDKMRAVKQGMMQSLLTGRVRLKTGKAAA